MLILAIIHSHSFVSFSSFPFFSFLFKHMLFTLLFVLSYFINSVFRIFLFQFVYSLRSFTHRSFLFLLSCLSMSLLLPTYIRSPSTRHNSPDLYLLYTYASPPLLAPLLFTILFVVVRTYVSSLLTYVVFLIRLLLRRRLPIKGLCSLMSSIHRTCSLY